MAKRRPRSEEVVPDSFGEALVVFLSSYHGWRATADAALGSHDHEIGQQCRADMVASANAMADMLKRDRDAS